MEKLRNFKTEEQFLTIKESLEYPQVSLTEDNGKVWVKNNKIKFYINVYNTSRELIETFDVIINNNMTWKELVGDDNYRIETNGLIPPFDGRRVIVNNDGTWTISGCYYFNNDINLDMDTISHNEIINSNDYNLIKYEC